MIKSVHIRFGEINDLPRIVDIYNQAIRSKNVTGDLTEFKPEERIHWFQKYTQNEYPIYVIEWEQNVIGYCTLSPYRSGRKAMAKVAEISYYLDYTYHRKGFATMLIKHVLDDCERTNKRFLLAIILDINLNSVGLLTKLNFKKWGYFPDIVELETKQCSHVIYGIDLHQSNM